MITELKIPENIIEQIAVQAKAEAPLEACGILAGKDATVEKMYKMTNTDKSSDHFMMDTAEQFAVMKDLRAAGLAMLAIYHSHPETPARPSQEDIRLALTPAVIYLVLSLQNADNPVIKGFSIEENTVMEVPVKILKKQE